MSLTLSAVIPTRNRPDDLSNAVRSVLAQTHVPDELIIVDQSPGDESEIAIRALFVGSERTCLVYVHDATVAGLVDAKRTGTSRASCEIVCFLEDDVVLEPGYLAAVARGFQTQRDMWGCGGVITNPPVSSPLYVAARSIFLRGIFRDPRPQIFVDAAADADQLIPCDVLSGGVSSWRRQVFDTVQFDTKNGFFMFEDMEFATRVVKALGHHLYVNPQARLAHYGSPVNRDVHGTRQRRKLSEALIFYKKRTEWDGAKVGLVMGMAWWFGEALLQTVRNRSMGPLRGYCLGILEGLRRPLMS